MMRPGAPRSGLEDLTAQQPLTTEKSKTDATEGTTATTCHRNSCNNNMPKNSHSNDRTLDNHTSPDADTTIITSSPTESSQC